MDAHRACPLLEVESAEQRLDVLLFRHPAVEPGELLALRDRAAAAPDAPAELMPFVAEISTPPRRHMLTVCLDHNFTAAQGQL